MRGRIGMGFQIFGYGRIQLALTVTIYNDTIFSHSVRDSNDPRWRNVPARFPKIDASINACSIVSAGSGPPVISSYSHPPSQTKHTQSPRTLPPTPPRPILSYPILYPKTFPPPSRPPATPPHSPRTHHIKTTPTPPTQRPKHSHSQSRPTFPPFVPESLTRCNRLSKHCCCRTHRTSP